jgi:hypothetical protein
MTALAANKDRRTRGTPRKGYGIGADSSTFYEGAIVCHNNAGKIAVGADAANFKAAGICTKYLVTGSSNTALVEFEYGHEEFLTNDTEVVNAGIGLDAVILDDATVTNLDTATNDVRLGRITQLQTVDGVSGVWVNVTNFGTAGAA